MHGRKVDQMTLAADGQPQARIVAGTDVCQVARFVFGKLNFVE